MSSYDNYIKDFPSRILKLSDKYSKQAKLDKLEVTFLISLAASGIAVPFDRLRPDGMYPDPFEDRNTFKNAAKYFDELYEKSFRESELWDSAFEGWQYGECDIGEIETNNYDKINEGHTVENIIKHLRDSLAHGVIRTSGDKEIEKIQLYTGKKKTGLKTLLITPESLAIFMIKWIEWLQTLDVPIWKKTSN